MQAVLGYNIWRVDMMFLVGTGCVPQFDILMGGKWGRSCKETFQKVSKIDKNF